MMNRRAVGYDINPLALLIAKVKTTPLAPQRLREALMAIEARIVGQTEAPELPDFPNLQYWFKPDIIADNAVLFSGGCYVSGEYYNSFSLIRLCSKPLLI